MSTTNLHVLDDALEAPPPFEAGMRLTRAEFRRLWDLHPEIIHAERIDGVVVMPAAKRHVEHGKPHGRLNHWLTTYEYATEGTESSLAPTVAIDNNNDPEPDCVLLIQSESGGNCQVTEDGYLEGSPELLSEISASSVATDLGRKLEIYEANGVQEYIVWVTEREEIHWFRLREGGYQPLVPDSTGIIRSEIFPGLWLDVPAMLRGDMRRVSEVLHEGLATREHAAFIERLRERRGAGGR